ncbi:MAG TPA: hypothetical protein VHE36_03285 [Sphingomicrobium sp.]|nr:hypothetical protein [Sphingomicrobium sp.]
MGDWLSRVPIWQLGLALFLVSVAALIAGARASGWIAGKSNGLGQLTEAQEGYVVTTVYTLLGLLVGFTFSIAIDRYQSRRDLVVRDAAAIEQLYLQTQLLGEPHRSRVSDLLARYAANHVELARATHDDAEAGKLIAEDDVLRRDLWTATVPAFQSIAGTDFSSLFVQSVNEVLTTDAARKAARRSEIPRAIIVLLILYSIVAAALLGAVMRTRRGQIIGVIVIALSVTVLTLITDINRPVEGTIHESQEPMERMISRLKANPPATYQRLAESPQPQ